MPFIQKDSVPFWICWSTGYRFDEADFLKASMQQINEADIESGVQIKSLTYKVSSYKVMCASLYDINMLRYNRFLSLPHRSIDSAQRNWQRTSCLVSNSCIFSSPSTDIPCTQQIKHRPLKLKLSNGSWKLFIQT